MRSTLCWPGQSRRQHSPSRQRSPVRKSRECLLDTFPAEAAAGRFSRARVSFFQSGCGLVAGRLWAGQGAPLLDGDELRGYWHWQRPRRLCSIGASLCSIGLAWRRRAGNLLNGGCDRWWHWPLIDATRRVWMTSRFAALEICSAAISSAQQQSGFAALANLGSSDTSLLDSRKLYRIGFLDLLARVNALSRNQSSQADAVDFASILA